MKPQRPVRAPRGWRLVTRGKVRKGDLCSLSSEDGFWWNAYVPDEDNPSGEVKRAEGKGGPFWTARRLPGRGKGA